MAVLSTEEIEARLAAMPGWELREDAITREFQSASFPEALLFVNAVGHAAEQADHHPDMDIRYRRVRMALATHSEQGITEKRI